MSYYYRTAPYATELNAKIVQIQDNGVILNNTIIYPGGGGQPSDTGKLIGAEFEATVTEAKKVNAAILHVLNDIKGKLTLGPVIVKLDWHRRYALMKAHTGEHILYRALELLFPVKFEKVELHPEESILFVSGALSYDDIQKAELLANSIISKGVPVQIQIANKDTISKEIRISKERIKDNTIRIVEILGFDKSACTGVHVKNTREIEMLVVTSIKKSKFLEIRFRVSDYAKTFIHNSVQLTRKLSDSFNLSINKLYSTLVAMNNDYQILKKAYYKLSAEMYRFELDSSSGINFYWKISNIGDFKGVQKRAHKLINTQRAIVLFGSEKELKIFLIFTKTFDIDIKHFHQIPEKYHQKYGGHNNFLLISTSNELIYQIFSELKQLIEKLLKQQQGKYIDKS